MPTVGRAGEEGGFLPVVGHDACRRASSRASPTTAGEHLLAKFRESMPGLADAAT